MRPSGPTVSLPPWRRTLPRTSPSITRSSCPEISPSTTSDRVRRASHVELAGNVVGLAGSNGFCEAVLMGADFACAGREGAFGSSFRHISASLQAVKCLISRGLDCLAGTVTIVQDFTDVKIG